MVVAILHCSARLLLSPLALSIMASTAVPTTESVENGSANAAGKDGTDGECSRNNFILARKRCLYSNSQIGKAKTQQHATKQIEADPQCLPRVTDLELQPIAIKTSSAAIPLFEKLLSTSDVDQKQARLVLPKKYAEFEFSCGITRF